MQIKSKKKIVFSIAALAILILSYSTALDVICQKTIDKSGEKYINETFKKAVYTYGIARITNGLISMIQATQINATPAGVGMTIGAGEILDPINDIIERFSLVMLVSTSSLGIQKILMEIGSWLGFKILLSLSMVVLIIGIWLPKIRNLNLINLGYKIILISIVVRFCIPAIGVVGNLTDNLFLSDKYNESTRSLEKLNKEFNEANLITEKFEFDNEETGYLDKLKSVYNSMNINNYMKKKVDVIKEKGNSYVPRLINLIVIFVIQTIMLPLFVFWLLIKLVGYLAGNNVPILMEQKIKGVIKK